MRSATIFDFVIVSDRPISIHALHAERDAAELKVDKNAKPFQSTRSMRSATRRRPVLPDLQRISIHALHAERDPSTA